MSLAGAELIIIFLVGLVGMVLPLAVLVMLFLIYNKLNTIEKLLSRRDAENP